MDKLEYKANEILSKAKHLELLEKLEPNEFSLLKEVAGSVTDIELSEFIENVAIQFCKNKNKYKEIDSKETRRTIISEQLELYYFANFKYQKYGVYATANYNKYKSILIEALEFWRKELMNFNNIKSSIPNYINPKTNEPFDYVLIGSLFAQDFIGEKKQFYCYGEKTFRDVSKLSRHINENILKDIKFDTIRVIVRASIQNSIKDGSIFTLRKMDLIISYCNDNNLIIKPKFQEEYNNLKSDY